MGLWSKNKVYFGTILGNGSTSSKNVSTAILASDTKGGIYIEEGDHPKHTCEKRSILEQPVFSRKKGSDNRPAINIIYSEYIHSLSSLQNGRLAFAKGNAERER